MEIIYLTNGKKVIVDEKDYSYLSTFTWSERGEGYAATTIAGVSIYMHRMLLNPPSNMCVDHINRNKLDNQRKNIRLCTCSQNGVNRALRESNTTGYIGVTWHKVAKKFQARIRLNGRKTHLGLFVSSEDAAKAYDEAAIKEFGDFAQLNSIKREVEC